MTPNNLPPRRTPPLGVPAIPESDTASAIRALTEWLVNSTAEQAEQVERLTIKLDGLRDAVGHLSEQMAVAQVRAEDCARRLDLVESEARDAKAQLASQRGARSFGGWIAATLLGIVAIILNFIRHR